MSAVNLGDHDEGLHPETSGKDVDAISPEHSSRRTSLAFQRTRLSADRTLMSIIRTSLALIGFGFTIFQFFRYLRESVGGEQIIRGAAPRNFGLALVLLGVAMLFMGICNHIAFMLQVRRERQGFVDRGLIPDGDSFPVSTTLIVAIVLLTIGMVAIFGMVMRAGPFH
jgi:putative membrane protein